MSALLRWVMVVVAIAVTAPAWAGSLVLQADTNELEVGQITTLTLIVEDDSPGSPPHVRAPDGLEIEYAHSDHQVRQINFKVKRLVRFKYRVTAVTPGEYAVGPVQVELGTSTLTTNPVRIRVVARPEVQGSPLRAEAEFLQEQAWEGQVVLYRYRLYSRVRTLRTQWSLPDFEGLVAPRDGNRPRREYRLEDPSGVIGVDETYIPYIVTGSGDLSQPSAVVRVDIPFEDGRRDPFRDPFRGFTQTKTEVFATQKAALSARPLPPAPVGFNGLVGDFSFSGSVEQRSVGVGESLTWKVEAVGDGSLEGFKLPAAGEIDGARLYDNSPTVGATVANETYTARGDFGRVIVPTRSGRLELPPVEIIAFSPSRGEYVTHRIVVAPIDVVAGAEGDADVESFAGEPVRRGEPAVAQGVREIRRRGADRALWLGDLLPWMLGLAGAPGLALIALTGGGRVVARLRARREASALSPLGRLARLPTDPEERLAVLDAAIRSAVARAGAVPDPLRREAEELLALLGRIRFAGDPPPDDLVDRALRLVSGLQEAT